MEHGGNGACGIPDGDTIIMTGGFGQNYVTRFVLELEVTGLEELLIYTTSNTFRYNTSGFVEELPQLPDIRRGHACLSFPTNGVRSKGPKSKPNLSNTGTCCRWWKQRIGKPRLDVDSAAWSWSMDSPRGSSSISLRCWSSPCWGEAEVDWGKR